MLITSLFKAVRFLSYNIRSHEQNHSNPTNERVILPMHCEFSRKELNITSRTEINSSKCMCISTWVPAKVTRRHSNARSKPQGMRPDDPTVWSRSTLQINRCDHFPLQLHPTKSCVWQILSHQNLMVNDMQLTEVGVGEGMRINKELPHGEMIECHSTGKK